MCTGAKVGFVFVLYRGVQLRIFGFKADEAMQKQIAYAAKNFKVKLDLYVNDQETDWYPIETIKDAQTVYDQASDETVNLPDLEAAIAYIAETRQAITEDEEVIKKLQAQIMAQMGDAKTLHAGKYLVTWGEMNFRAVPEKVIPAKPARTVRNANLRIKDNG